MMLPHCDGHRLTWITLLALLGLEAYVMDAMFTSMLSWWRHQMESFIALLALCEGNSPVTVDSPHKGQWRGALMFSLICAWINAWVNNRVAGDSRRHSAYYDVTVMVMAFLPWGHWRAVCRHFDFFKASLHNSNGNHLSPGQENLILF